MDFLDLFRIPKRIERLEKQAMADHASIDTLKQDQVKLRQDVVSLITAINAKIKALQDQIASGVPVTQADLDGLHSGNADTITAIEAEIASLTATPAPPPANG